jgi:hypothetical protein
LICSSFSGEIVEFNDFRKYSRSSKCRSLWSWLDDKLKVSDVADYVVSSEAYKELIGA